jgi:hypothetical protein
VFFFVDVLELGKKRETHDIMAHMRIEEYLLLWRMALP